jgi:hypothetical protein
MKIKNIYISPHNHRTPDDIYSSVEIDCELEGLEVKSRKLSPAASLEIIRIAEEDIQAELEEKVKDLSRARLQPAVNLIEAKTTVIED